MSALRQPKGGILGPHQDRKLLHSIRQQALVNAAGNGRESGKLWFDKEGERNTRERGRDPTGSLRIQNEYRETGVKTHACAILDSDLTLCVNNIIRNPAFDVT